MSDHIRFDEPPRPPCRKVPAAGGVTSTGQAGAPAPEGDSPPARPSDLCECGHVRVLHGLSKAKRRTACSVSSGPKATPCGCRAFTAAAARPFNQQEIPLMDQPGFRGDPAPAPYVFTDRDGDYLLATPARDGDGVDLVVTEAKTRRRAAVTIPANRLSEVVTSLYRKAGHKAPLMLDPDETAGNGILTSSNGGA